MSDLKKQERTAVEAVARRFSAACYNSGDPPDSYIKVAGKRIAVDIVTLKPRGAGQVNAAKPHLRFDKVASRLMERLQANLGETVPAGTIVLLTITAPIRLPSKTAAALEDRIQTLLDRRPRHRGEKDTIHGNRVQIRLLKHESERAPKMIGFVHNSDSDPLLLLNRTRELLERISAVAGRQETRLATSLGNERWLVVVSAGGISWSETYRHICSQLRAADFRKILMVSGDGRVEVSMG
jgi:hypothetical protein